MPTGRFHALVIAIICVLLGLFTLMMATPSVHEFFMSSAEGQELPEVPLPGIASRTLDYEEGGRLEDKISQTRAQLTESLGCTHVRTNVFREGETIVIEVGCRE